MSLNFLESGCSTERAIKLAPNSVSGLVVKTVIEESESRISK